MSFRDLLITRNLEERIKELGPLGLKDLEVYEDQLKKDLADVEDEHKILKNRLDLIQDKIKEIKQGGGDD
jgi:chromosome segregation ATPase